MRNGRRCGKTSAYIRPGGAHPMCYPVDVTADMIKPKNVTTKSVAPPQCGVRVELTLVRRPSPLVVPDRCLSQL